MPASPSEFLIDGSIDDPGDAISGEEYDDRRSRVAEAVGQAGLDAFVGFGDCWRAANVCYFTPFRPLDGVSDIANAVVVLEPSSEATLFVSAQCVDDAQEMTRFPVRPLAELVGALESINSRNGSATKRVGLGGSFYIPASLLDRIRSGFAGSERS